MPGFGIAMGLALALSETDVRAIRASPSYGCDVFLTLACSHLPRRSAVKQSVPADYELYEVVDDAGNDILSVYVGNAPMRVDGTPAFEETARGRKLQAFAKPEGDTIRIDIVVAETKQSPLTTHLFGHMDRGNALVFAHFVSALRPCAYKRSFQDCRQRAAWEAPLTQFILDAAQRLP
jgi:hypothetical protein